MRDKDPTVIHLPARGQRYYRKAARYYRTVMRYYRTGPRYCHKPSNDKVRSDAQELRAVLPRARYYRASMRYYRKAEIP